MLLQYIAHIVSLSISRKQVMNQLRSALSNALAADRAKTFFLSSMSHEIRTPLNAVIGFTDLLKDKDLDPEIRDDYLRSVSEASQALLTLLNDILELSKLTSGKIQAHRVMTDMRAFVNEMDTLFRPGASRKHLALEFSTASMPKLYVDQARFRQILFNLIGNAIKFTDEGAVSVSLTYERNDADFGTLTLRVADTGCGIEEEDRKKIFEPFIQMSRMRGTNASCSGTGLGLSIVKRIVEQAEGTFTLESAVGRGSTFTVTIPRIAMHPVVHEEKEAVFPPKSLPDGTKTPEKKPIPRVLIVDEAEMALEILSRMMDWMHVPHVKADSAEAALEILEKESFDIMMTDLLMPGMSGAELAKTVRDNPRCAGMRIIAMSTENEAIMYDRQLFDEVMLKPIVRNVLYDRIFEESGHGK